MDWSVITLRQLPFSELEAFQRERHAEVVQDPERAFLILSEPHAAFTAGRGAPEGEKLWNEAQLTAQQITCHRVSRGGRWTYHGPGQIVVYPIVSLRTIGMTRHGAYHLLQAMRKAIGNCLSHFDVASEFRDKPFGVYAGGAKIASFGIAVERGVSLHGVALYHGPQTAGFMGIHPCGVVGERVTSVVEQGCDAPWESVSSVLSDEMKNCFKPLKT